MVPSIALKAATAHFNSYRQLLVHDWTETSVEKVAEILKRLLFGKKTASAGTKAAADVDRLAQLLDLLNATNFAELPDEGSLHSAAHVASTKLRSAIVEKATLLCAQGLWRLQGDVGFFHDCQSLLSQTLLHCVLPNLNQAANQEEKTLLLHALWFQQLTWSSDPAHQQFLRAAIYAYLGEGEKEVAALLHAFHLTPRDDEDFMNKLQSVWMSLQEQGKTDEAKRFLFDAYRLAPADALTEIETLLAESLGQLVGH